MHFQHNQTSANLARNLLAGFVLSIAAICFWLLPVSPASAEPARYEGRVQSCSDRYPGSFLDIGRNECWACPKSYPHRTVLPVDGNNACERRAHTDYRRAAGPEAPTGIIRTDCRPGYFLDASLGQCYSCQGYTRTTASVKSAKACSKRIAAARTKAVYKGVPKACPEGSFDHLLSGYCFSCPAGTYRNANTGNDPRKFNACTKCGGENARPCPVTTLRKSCDDFLEEDFAKGICVITKKERMRRDAAARLEAMGPELAIAIDRAVAANEDEELKSGLEAKSPQSASRAKAEVQAAINPCFSDANKTWTLGVVADAQIGLGGGLETGVAVDVSVPGRTGSQRPVFGYGGMEYHGSLSAGGSAGINYGCWRAENNALAGDYHGIAIDLVSASKLGIAAATKNAELLKPGKGVAVTISFWYDPHSGKFDPENDYLGFTVAVAGGMGADITGFSYVRGTTGQITGTFPPPLGNDKVFGAFYTFQDNPARRNEFVMQGPNQVSVRSAPEGEAPGKWHIYLRKGFSANVFKAKGSDATYTIEDNGSLTWRGRPGDPNPIILVQPQ